MYPDDQLLSAYLDGEVSDETRAHVEEALAADPDCRERYDRFCMLRRSLDQAPEPDFEDAQHRVWYAIGSARKARSERLWSRRVSIPIPAAVAAAVVAFAVGSVFTLLAVADGLPSDPPTAGVVDESRIRLDRAEVEQLLGAMNAGESYREIRIDLPESPRFEVRGEPALVPIGRDDASEGGDS